MGYIVYLTNLFIEMFFFSFRRENKNTEQFFIVVLEVSSFWRGYDLNGEKIATGVD